MKISDVKNSAYLKSNVNYNKMQKLPEYPCDSFELTFKGMKKKSI